MIPLRIVENGQGGFTATDGTRRTTLLRCGRCHQPMISDPTPELREAGVKEMFGVIVPGGMLLCTDCLALEQGEMNHAARIG